MGRVGLLLLALFLGIGATLPALPDGVREAGGGGAALGVALGAFPFAALAGRVLGGRWTDRRGRVWTLRAGLGVSLAAGLLLVLPLPVAGIVTARLLHGLADALVYTAAAAYLLDRSPPERRPQALALMGTGIWAGYALGPVVGAFLDLQQVGLVVLAGTLAGLALTRGLPEGTRPAAAPGGGVRALVPRGSLVPGVALGLGNLGYAAVVGFLVLHLDDRGAAGAVALTAFSTAVLAGRVLVVPLAVRVGILRTLPAALLAMTAGLLVVAATRSTAVAVAAAVVIGLGYCLPFPALGALVAGRVREDQRGAAVGALTASYDLFVGVGSLAFGLLADGLGTPAVFVAAAVGTLAAGALDAGLARDEARRPLVPAGPAGPAA